MMAHRPLIFRSHPAREGVPPHPGFLLLHGRGADENDLLPLANELDPRLYTVTVRAPFDFPWGGYMWYSLDESGIGFPDPATLGESLSLLRAFVDEMPERFRIDRKRLYAGGFSMGAAMSASLALTDPQRIAGAAVLSGYLPLAADLPFQPEAAAGHPVFQAHGTLDPVIPVMWAQQTRDFFSQTPVALTYREYPIGHEITLPELKDLDDWFAGTLGGNAEDTLQALPDRTGAS